MKLLSWKSGLLFGLAIATSIGCGVAVDPEPLPEDYVDWYRVDTTGDLPGHGDTYRIIYVNDVARTYTGAGTYPIGSIIAKEVRKISDGQPTELSYIAIMRRLEQAPGDGSLHDGWLFTIASDADSQETYKSSCWNSCHSAAPYRGLFLQYSP